MVALFGCYRHGSCFIEWLCADYRCFVVEHFLGNCLMQMQRRNCGSDERPSNCFGGGNHFECCLLQRKSRLAQKRRAAVKLLAALILEDHLEFPDVFAKPVQLQFGGGLF